MKELAAEELGQAVGGAGKTECPKSYSCAAAVLCGDCEIKLQTGEDKDCTYYKCPCECGSFAIRKRPTVFPSEITAFLSYTVR